MSRIDLIAGILRREILGVSWKGGRGRGGLI